MKAVFALLSVHELVNLPEILAETRDALFKLRNVVYKHKQSLRIGPRITSKDRHIARVLTASPAVQLLDVWEGRGCELGEVVHGGVGVVPAGVEVDERGVAGEVGRVADLGWK